MSFEKLSLNVIEVTRKALECPPEDDTELSGTYQTRIMSDGKQEATDTVTY
jgi:hypothetical protein